MPETIPNIMELLRKIRDDLSLKLMKMSPDDRREYIRKKAAKTKLGKAAMKAERAAKAKVKKTGKTRTRA